MTEYQKLSVKIKDKIEEIVSLHKSKLRADKNDNHILISILDALELKMTKSAQSKVEKDPFDPVSMCMFLKKYTKLGSNTEGNFIIGKRDDTFITDLKRFLDEIITNKSNKLLPVSAELNFSENKFKFFHELFKDNPPPKGNLILKNEDYHAFLKANPMFSKYNITLSDIQFIRVLHGLISFKKNPIIIEEKGESKQNIADPMAEEIRKMKDEMSTMKEDIAAANQKAGQYDSLMGALQKLLYSRARIKTLLMADPSEEAKTILALMPANTNVANNPQGFFNASNTNVSAPVALNYGKFIAGAYTSDGKFSQENVYKSRFDLFNNLMEIVNSTDGTVSDGEKKIFQLAIYYLLRHKYTLTIQGVFDLLNQNLTIANIEVPDELAANFKISANQDELKESIQQELSLEEATMFKKFYTGTSQFPAILPSDDIAKNDFDVLSKHLHNPAKYPTYENPDVFAAFLTQYQPGLAHTPK